MSKYSHIGLGGTFDHFHQGHVTFLTFAAQQAETLIIGVTSDEFIEGLKRFPQSLETYDQRVAAIQAFCNQEKITCEIVTLSDIYGPTLSDERIQALCATKETEANAKKINLARQEKGLEPLPIHVAPYFLDETNQPLHALDIRSGRANREGVIYSLLFKNALTLNEAQRDFFAKPQGPVLQESDLKDEHNTPFVVVVGDSALETFITHKIKYDLGIYDFQKKRQEDISDILKPIEPELTATNPAGSISLHLTKSLQTALNQNLKHLFVQGEEDLATVALFLLLPLNSIIYYGQPNQGIVRVEITEEFKDTVYQVLKLSS
jgi:pantetheine-phosphate adenylyltransferase